MWIFQSTPPARGATGDAEGYARHGRNFNPRPPRGGRPGESVVRWTGGITFQSTPPARGATEIDAKPSVSLVISIHAPREGGDSKDAQFYPRIFDK